MNKFLLLLIFVLGCTPTEQQINEAALRLESLRKMCSRVAVSLGGLGEIQKDYDAGNLVLYCQIYNPKNKNNPITSFEPRELMTVQRYLSAKESIK